jgi:flagellar biosynthesis chaperone FliJ
MRARRLTSVIFGSLLVLSALAIFIFRQDISDYMRLRSYSPTAEIVALADNTTLLPDYRRLFYVNHPEVTEKDNFNNHCRDHANEFTIVLGCYIQNNGIYLLNVTDERLKGIKEVTAAHELLHAAYDRLSSKERASINILLEDTFANLVDDRIKSTIELYRQQDPSIVTNELHSILGTEVRTLPSELEEYYSRYFANRSGVVSYSEQYEQAFVERRNQIRDYDLQLSELKSTIDAMEANLKQTSTNLKAQRDQMNAQRNSGDVTNYNAQVPIYNSRVNQYNRDIDTLSSLIVQFNDIVQKRNSIAAEEAELVEAIDSRNVVPSQQ